MKKIVLILLALTMAFALFACKGDTCSHVDENPKDAVCDNCQAAIPCKICVDADKNAKCDVCGKDVICAACSDANKDAKCDVCGKDVACEACVDADKDAKCDVCGKAVACTACVDANKDGKCDVCKKEVPVNYFEDFEAAIGATKPAGFTADVKVETEVGILEGIYTATIASNGSVTVNYSFDNFNSIGQGGADDVSNKKEGTVTVDAAASATAGNVASLNLDESLLDDLHVSANALSATVASENTEAVLGVELESDATFALFISNGKVTAFTLTYEIEAGNVEITCEYK